MKRFHVHLHVHNLAQSVGFYTHLFAAEPTRLEGDYAKWMLEDPPVNFAISTRGHATGIDHLGIQTDNADDLAELKARAEAADLSLLDEGATTCCYARSEKHWVTDPQGMAWEHFHTLGNIPVFKEGEDNGACCTPAAADSSAPQAAASAGGCCTPAPAEAAPAQACCAPAGTAAAPVAAPQGRGKPIGIAVKSASGCC